MTKYIHIHAKCNAFEIFQQVPEKIAVNTLTKIRKNFLSLKRRHIGDKLLVKILKVNPELPFGN